MKLIMIRLSAGRYKHKPKMIIGGFSAYSRVVDWKRMRATADRMGALFVVDMAHVAGLVAAGEYPNPVPIADVVTSTTHKTLRGPRGRIILARSNPEIEKKLNSMVFPGTYRWSLMHVIAAKPLLSRKPCNLNSRPINDKSYVTPEPWPAR